MINFLRHFFTPHHTNNQRAKLLHSDILFLVAGIFLLATAVISSFQDTHPQVLGISTNISLQDLVLLTNEERQKAGLAPLAYSQDLANAAQAKADDMFKYDYWAHISPTTQRTPWYFIQNAGYHYIYAGENLARGFSTAQDAVNAWMGSPSHRDNILSPHYQDIGFAVEEGPLTGEKDTVLIVEMFGSRQSLVNPTPAPSQQVSAGLPVTTVLAAGSPQAFYKSITTSPIIDRVNFAKHLTESLLMLFISLLVLDFLLIEKRKLSRFVGHNLDHILFLTALLIFVIIIGAGAII